jgi:hypothetical protein
MYAVEKCKPRMGIETAAMYDAEEPFYTRYPNHLNASDAR